MSLPSSEPLPDDIHELSPARQRHLRRMPRAASPAEHGILLDSLNQQTSPSLDFFLFVLLGSLAIGAMLYFREPILLVLAITVFSFPTPIFGLALLPATLRLSSGLKSALSLGVYIGFAFLSGILAGWLAPTALLSNLAIFHFTAPYWLDLTVLVLSTVLSCFILIRQDRLPRLLGVLLTYEIAIPLSLAGFGLFTQHAQLWPGALLTGMLHLGIALVLAIFTFIILSFTPKNMLGWLLALVPLAITLPLLTATIFFLTKQAPQLISTPPVPIQTQISPTSPPIDPTTTPTDVPLTPTAPGTRTPTNQPMKTLTPTITPTPEPTTFLGLVAAPEGAIIRVEPSFAAEILTYVNDRDPIEILGETMDGNTRWYQVETASGKRGWLLGSLVHTPTPTPESAN